MKILTRKEMDGMKCMVPGCMCGGIVVIHSQCHITEPTWVNYDPACGCITIKCAKCDKVITKIKVADEFED